MIKPPYALNLKKLKKHLRICQNYSSFCFINPWLLIKIVSYTFYFPCIEELLGELVDQLTYVLFHRFKFPLLVKEVRDDEKPLL